MIQIIQGNSLDLLDTHTFNIKPKLIILSPPDLAETSYTLEQYKIFINEIYNKALNILDKDGVIISITTDRKLEGEVYCKHMDIIDSLRGKTKLFNYKIWAKSLGVNLYILNYSHILCFRRPKAKSTNNKEKEWYKDVLLYERDKIAGYPSKDSFPTQLIELIIKNFTNEGDLVLDPFIGSGKTAYVCRQLNRNCIGFELEQKHVELINSLMCAEG